MGTRVMVRGVHFGTRLAVKGVHMDTCLMVSNHWGLGGAVHVTLKNRFLLQIRIFIFDLQSALTHSG